MTVTIGSWGIPALFTLLCFAAAIGFSPKPRSGGYFPDFGAAIIGGFLVLIAAIVSLVGWLLWALA